jgi:hypothetical protein
VSRLSGIRTRFVVVAALVAAALPTATSCLAAPVTVARLQYAGGDWYCDPSSLPNWLGAFAVRTGVETADAPATVTMDSEDLYRYPLLYLVGHGGIELDDREVNELRRYLDAGGFLYANDNYGLDPAFRALMARVYPESPLRPLGSEHPIYHCFYDLPGLPKIHEHDGAPAQGFGIEREGRLVVFYSWSSDIGDGLEDAQVHGDPPEAREAAVRMAVNILTYALTRP